ncbi:MBL fold metallo-hydrolase [Streptomyces sp. NPDC002602]|uniref:MBL fold metallo-hydrolase n=1 Tax=Streptomyces sp. NPDC002602 TaxID=3364654 RepID=UPI00368F6E26
MAASTTLSYEVLVLDGDPSALEDMRLPDGGQVAMSPLSVTLIHGERDAVLVDPPFTFDQAREVGDWIERSGKRLAFMYVTHGHGDHWFAAGELIKRFPGVKVYATPGTIEEMRRAIATRGEQFDLHFPDRIPPVSLIAEPVPADGLELEGNLLQAVEVGHTDTDETTVLHVPSIGLVVAGDAVYNGVHQHLDEGSGSGLRAWLTALDKIEALAPSSVVAGHKNRALPDDPATIGETRDYLQNAIRLLDSRPEPVAFFEEMVRLYPDHLNRTPLWLSAAGLLGR